MTKEAALDAIWMRCRHNDKTFEAYCVLMRELGLNELGGGDRVKPELAKELNELKLYEDAISRQAAIDIIESWLSCDDYNEAERHIMRATKSILKDLPSVTPAEKTLQFAEWVATEIFDENWELNKDAFAEIACRKLAKLGIVRANGDVWELVDSQESEDKNDT